MSMPTKPRIILLTGCSRGIGLATSDLLARRGHIVCATARRPDAVEHLSANLPGDSMAMRLDVTDTDSIAAVTDALLQRFGRIDVLINNAGFGQIGAVEDVTADRWRLQMDTNVVGVVRMCRAVLPAMRSRGSGTIINVSSIVAHVAVPLMAAYCASKHALEALTTALRIETAAFGIRVVAIEPGPVASGFQEAAEQTAHDISASSESPYARHYAAFEQSWTGSYRRGVKSPEAVARVIARAAESRRPRRRYRIGLIGKMAPPLVALTPDFLLDLIARRMLSAGGPPAERIGKKP